ncbi:MAG: MarR family transcriptional regulator [Rhodobacterales bacterium]|nr:MarR family transcriptional regulator [Rhodobacterales bacterium]
MTTLPDTDDLLLDREAAADTSDRLEIRFWLRLLTCTTLIERRIRTGLSQDFKTTLPRFDAMAQLERAPGGLTMGQLSRRMMVSNGNVTGVVDRLVGDGLAERVSVPGDRRANVVRLTKRGRAAFADMARVHHGWLHDMLAAVPVDELATLHGQLATLKASILAAQAADDPED